MKLRLEVLDRKGWRIVAAFVGAMSATLVGAINNANIQPGVGNCQYWNPFASRLIAQPGVPTYNSPELAAWMTDLDVNVDWRQELSGGNQFGIRLLASYVDTA